jgi:type IX secretion system PorP/SprF family membrane protein
VLNTTSLDAMYSYHLKVSRWLSLTGGLQASVGQRSRNAEGLVLPDQLAGLESDGLPGDSKFYPDFAVGFGAFYKNMYGGIAYHHLVEPYMSTSKDPNTRLHRRYTAHIGALIPIFENRFHREILQLSPNLVFFQQDIYQHINYGLEALYRNFMCGVWLRQDLRFSYGTMIFSLGYARERFRFRYSYDAKLSSPELHIPNMGAHEISMAIVFENLHNTKRKRAIKSPKI